MHPRQTTLTPDQVKLWRAAVHDAGLSLAECLLWIIQAPPSAAGYSGLHYSPGLSVAEAGQLDEQTELLSEMDSPECIEAARIIVWGDRTIEGLAAVIRHELEHVRQHSWYGQRIENLHLLAEAVFAERAGALPGSAIYYNLIPTELDANAAAAMFARTRFGADRVLALLNDHDHDSAYLRSLVGPAPLDSLPERMLAFFASQSELCERFAQRQGLTFGQILDLEWSGAGSTWRGLIHDGGIAIPR